VVVTATTHPDVLEAGVSATTDADGYYTLTGLRSTSYRLIFTYVGTGDYAAVSRPATGSLAGSTVNITIAPGFTVSGNVGLDLATRPVGAGDVRVTVENWGGGDGPSTLTDSLGNYQIQGLVQGTYGLRFEVVGSDTYPIWYWAPGYPTGSEFRPTPQLGLSSNRSGLDVVIGAGGFIEGEVVDSAGAPIEGATVWATGLHRTGPDQGDAVADMQFSALTEADGSYRISGIPGRYDYIVDFESTGFAPTTWSGYSLYYQPELIRPDQAPLPVDVDAVLYAEGSISGTVTGAGIAEHSDDVWVEVAVFDYGSGRWVRTGDSYAVEPDGTYVVPHLYPDNYRLWARYSGELGSRSISSPTLEVGEGDDITANFGSLLPAEFSFVKTDFTGEAVADLLARSSTGDLYLFRGNGASGWSGQTLVGRGWAKFTAVVTVGDFSGDGFSDVMARNAKGELFVFRGNGAAGWLGSAKVGSGWASFTAIIGPGDFNGDGFVDVLARNAKGDLYMFRGNGSGGWLGSVKVGSGWNSFTAITAAGDFDGDGYADVLARRSTGALFLFPGNGAGGWLPSRQVGAGWNSFNSIVGGSDYSGDGFVDVIVRNTKGELHLFCGDGAGGWLGSVKVGSGWTKLSIAA
jgi:hypothetical protein